MNSNRFSGIEEFYFLFIGISAYETGICLLLIFKFTDKNKPYVVNRNGAIHRCLEDYFIACKQTPRLDLGLI